MLLQKRLTGIAIVLALGLLGYWVISTGLRRGAPICQVCARPVHSGQEYTLSLAEDMEEHACCPRCGIHFYLTNKDQVRAAWATDYATGEKIVAERAIYVEGSDLMTCCSTPPLKRELERTYELVWDRCLPSLIAFKTQSEAQQFQQQHRGRVLSYDDALQSVANK